MNWTKEFLMSADENGRHVDLKSLLSSAQLPGLPQSAIRLLELSRDPENGPAEFAMPIEADPGLTGQVLRFVNSSFFGFSREISSVKLGITLVGVRTVKNFALWSAVFSLMPNPKCGPFDLKSLWQDSLRRGLFARAMGKLLGLREAEEAFAAALLQDMAIPLLAKELPDEYNELLNARQDNERRLSDLERERFGWDHADAAALMAKKWNLPAEFTAMISQHVTPDILAPDLRGHWAQIAVALSSLLPSVTDPRWNDAERFEQIYTTLRPIGNPSVAQVLAQVDREFCEFAPVLKLPSPAKTLAAVYEESHEMASA
jgi:HD-like signal output (HDOD) protein